MFRPVTVLKGFGCVAHPVKLDVGKPLGLLGVSVSHHRNVIDVTELFEVFTYLGFLGVLQKRLGQKNDCGGSIQFIVFPSRCRGWKSINMTE